MRQTTGWKRGACFWVGVILLSISALFWLILIWGVTANSEGIGDTVLAGVIFTTIPVGIGIYCVRRGRKAATADVQRGLEPFESPKVWKTSITKDTQSEIVIKQQVRFRALAWFVLIFGISLLLWGVLALVGIVPDEDEDAFMLCGVGLFVVLVGMCILGMITTKISFFQPDGCVIVTRSGWPLFLWFLRTKRFSKEEAGSVFVCPVARQVTAVTGSINVSGGGTVYTSETSTRTAYVVKVVTRSGKEEAVHGDWNQDVSNYLARRILEFSQKV